jgi:uncharacterized protein (DUF58 family)
MLTDRGIGFAGGAVALWLASRAFGVPELQMASVGALALLLCAVVFTRLSSARLEVERTVRPTRLFHDAEARVTCTVRNTSRLPTAMLELRDTVPAALSPRGADLVSGPLPPGGTRELGYHLRGHLRGRYTVGPLTARLRDPFGLVARRVELPGEEQLVVYPPVWRLPEGVPLGGVTNTGGHGRPKPLPSGDELATVREYVRGDDLRKVHWPTTAHRGKLMIRQPESPQDPRAVVLLDTRGHVHQGAGPTGSLEAAVTTAASAVHHLAAHGRAVTLVDGPVGPVPTPQPWRTWLARLAEVRGGDVDLGVTLHQLGSGAAGDGMLLAIVAVPTPAELGVLVRAGRSFNTRLAVLIDVASHGGRSRDRGGAQEIAGQLRLAGWHVTVLAAGDRIDHRWAELALHAGRTRTGAAP